MSRAEDDAQDFEFDWAAAEGQVRGMTLGERAEAAFAVLQGSYEHDLLVATAEILRDVLGTNRHEARDVKVKTYTNSTFAGGHAAVFVAVDDLDFRVLFPASGDAQLQLRNGGSDLSFEQVHSLEDIGRVLSTHSHYAPWRKARAERLDQLGS